MPAGGGGWQPGMPGGNDMHVSAGAGIGVGRGYVVGEYQEGPSTVTDTYTVVAPTPKGPIICGLSVVGLIILYVMAAGMTSDVHVTATQHRWTFAIHTQVFAVRQHGDWQRNVPGDSYNRMCRLRQSGTHRRLINTVCHTEHTTRTSQSCSTSNGIQHCQTVTTPVAQQVCQNIYQYYRDYDTWCDYNVNRWVAQNPAVSSGVGLAPYWPYAQITNCGMLGCTRLGHTTQDYMVDFHIDDGHSAGSTDTCDWSNPSMWGWLNDNSHYQAQASHFGSHLLCETLQTPEAAPPPSHYQFVPTGGNSSDVLPQYAPAPPPPPGPLYAPGGEYTGDGPHSAPAPPPAFLAAEEPEITITELDAGELAEMSAPAAPTGDEATE